VSPIVKELLTTDIGLMSIAVLVVSVVIIGYLVFMLVARSAKP